MHFLLLFCICLNDDGMTRWDNLYTNVRNWSVSLWLNVHYCVHMSMVFIMQKQLYNHISSHFYWPHYVKRVNTAFFFFTPIGKLCPDIRSFWHQLPPYPRWDVSWKPKKIRKKISWMQFLPRSIKKAFFPLLCRARGKVFSAAGRLTAVSRFMSSKDLGCPDLWPKQKDPKMYHQNIYD